MNLREYERVGRECYQKLSAVVGKLLERAISIEQGYRLQQIQHRVRTVQSLAKRLKEIDQSDTDNIESYRKDLAGCRIVFYTNDDVQRFVSSGILREQFDIDWDRSRVHQPSPEEKEVSKLLTAGNNGPRGAAGRCGRGGARMRHLWPLVGCGEGRGMYGVELYAAVRLAVVEEGLSHREAGRRFGIDRRTVKKMLSYSAPPGYRRSKPVRWPKLEASPASSTRFWRRTGPRMCRASSATRRIGSSSGCGTSTGSRAATRSRPCENSGWRGRSFGSPWFAAFPHNLAVWRG